MRIASGESSARPSASARLAQPIRRDLVGDLEQDHGVERLADLVEHRVERLGLRDRARKAVEHERVLVRESLANETDHEVVGHEIASLEDRSHLPTELGAVGDRLTEDVPCRDVRHVVGGRDPLRLGALAGALRAEDEDSHVDADRGRGKPRSYLRKPS